MIQFEARRGVREVYGAALEKRCGHKVTVGSNPTLSATLGSLVLARSLARKDLAMRSTNLKLEKFFAEYETTFDTALSETTTVDVEETARAFADCFMAANPNGVMCGKNDEQFRTVIPQGCEFYRNIGPKSMEISSLTVTVLDDCHAMAKVHWQALHVKKDSSEELIDFDVTYLLQTIGEKPKTFAYITGDEQKLLRERGQIPG